jgi:hypothetical protein
MTMDKLFVVALNLNEMTVDVMLADEMPIDRMTCCH